MAAHQAPGYPKDVCERWQGLGYIRQMRSTMQPLCWPQVRGNQIVSTHGLIKAGRQAGGRDVRCQCRPLPATSRHARATHAQGGSAPASLLLCSFQRDETYSEEGLPEAYCAGSNLALDLRKLQARPLACRWGRGCSACPVA